MKNHENLKFQNVDFPKFHIFLKLVPGIYPTLKSHNFFAIEPILEILDVLESSRPLHSHNCIYFSGRFHERSSNLMSKMPRFCHVLCHVSKGICHVSLKVCRVSFGTFVEPSWKNKHDCAKLEIQSFSEHPKFPQSV